MRSKVELPLVQLVEEIRRGETAQKILTLKWDYPVFEEEARDAPSADATSQARLRTSLLSREQALAEIAGDDPRPLLVLRECDWCKGSDDALLSTRFDNEKTILLSHLFHAVKLPNHVLTDEHPFRNLFEGSSPPHLFLCLPDGSELVPLSGGQSQSELWDAMATLLEESYGKRKVDRLVKSAYKLLDEFDRLDEEEILLRRRHDLELEKRGPRSSKVKSLRRDLTEVQERRAEVRTELDGLYDGKVG